MDINFYLLFLAIMAFIAGYIDAVVGGGGLIQIPSLFIAYPHEPLSSIFGTNKLSSIAGTITSAYQYAKRIVYDKYLLVTSLSGAFIGSFLGARSISLIDVNMLKPVMLCILIVMCIYVYTKKDLGDTAVQNIPRRKRLIYGAIIGLVVGFYDGFFGPGAGSFFVLGFVLMVGFDFLHASAYAKIMNVCTNFSALMVFLSKGHILLGVACVMAVCNVVGSVVGTRSALKNGNAFVKKVFLVVVILLIIRYAYDIFINTQ
jgi:uncharacterized protein